MNREQQDDAAAAPVGRPASDPAAALALAIEHRRAGRLPEAAAACRDMLAAAPDHADADNLLGVVLMEQGRLDEALDCLRRVLERRPDHVQAHCNIALILKQQGRLEAAAESFQRAVVAKPDFAEAHNGLGLVFQAMGRLDEAAAAFRRALAAKPGNAIAAIAHSNLGMVLEAQGKADEAIAQYRRAIALNPNLAEAHNNLGNPLQAQGRLDEAIQCYRRAIALKPDYATAHTNLGNTLLLQGNPDEAAAAHARALALDPGSAPAHCNLGNALKAQGRLEEAAAAYRRAIALSPDMAVAHGNLGTVFQELGRLEEALACYLDSLALQPDSAEVNRMVAEMKTFEPGDAQIASMEELLARPNLRRKDRSQLMFALAWAYDQLGNPNRALELLAEANKIERQTIDYDPAVEETLVDRIIHSFSKSVISRTTGFGFDSDLPIFIVGMPQSGKSLVEMILSTHPCVSAAAEGYELERLGKSLSSEAGGGDSSLEGAARLTAEQARTLGEAYVAELRSRFPGTAYVTNTRPNNIRYLGLLHFVLPRARIICCSRDPLDNCLSCYFKCHRMQRFAFDLAELGHFYRLYERLMNHWRAVLPVPMLEIRYEELVADPARVSHRIFAYCGLEAGAVHPGQSGDPPLGRLPVKLHTQEVGRWRRYRAHLGTLMDALQISRNAP